MTTGSPRVQPTPCCIEPGPTMLPLKEATTSLYYQQKQEVRDTYVRKKDPELSIAGYRTQHRLDGQYF